MKKLLLAAMILVGSSLTVNAQKFTQPNPVHEQQHPRDVKLFKEKAGQLSTALNANDVKGSQNYLSDLMHLMSYRGDELVRAKAPKNESEAKYYIARQMKSMLGDVMANKQTILDLIKQAEVSY